MFFARSQDHVKTHLRGPGAQTLTPGLPQSGSRQGPAALADGVAVQPRPDVTQRTQGPPPPGRAGDWQGP